MTPAEAIVFWLVWVVIFGLGCLIFLNFIIADVGSSYETVKEDIESLIYKSRASMVMETEDFLEEKDRENKTWFPLAVVVRVPQLD